jgi:hypothetical protein
MTVVQHATRSYGPPHHTTPHHTTKRPPYPSLSLCASHQPAIFNQSVKMPSKTFCAAPVMKTLPLASSQLIVNGPPGRSTTYARYTHYVSITISSVS